ncbi:hypothetical protein KC19_VG194800 [Ceratodon purpureus]|uniref:Uncharacterized protein n=1 Tax=Ceratodon purpureus TaxID=3225 RepID=A0A8T0HS51_CERPU|nr:hypothetical protein KC19_VG194800 [Ceratodon purpureus]
MKHVQERSSNPYIEVVRINIASGFGPISSIMVARKMDHINFFIEGKNLVRISCDTGDEPIFADCNATRNDLSGIFIENHC